ncbi:MAG: DUF6504 family protein [Dehalococcoidia bacterium]
MRCDGDMPRALRQRGRWLAVESVLDCWRTDDRWWTPAPVSRAYYELLLEDGRVATVYHDMAGGGWYQHRS